MDDAAQHGEFILGESFAAILTETTQSLVCVYDRDGADPAVQRRVRARDRVLARRGARPRRARLRDPAGGARGVRRVPGLRVEDRHAEPAGRPLADQGRRPAADRVVQPADDRRRRRAGRAGHHRHRPHRPRAAAATRTTARCRAIRRPSSSRSRAWRPSSARCGGWRRWSRRRSAPTACSWRSPRSARGCCRSTRRRSFRYGDDGTATIVGRHNRDNVEVLRVGERLEARESSAVGRVLRTGAPARIDDWGGVRDDARSPTRSSASATAPPPPRRSSSRGALWGAVAITSEDPLPHDTEDRLGAFCELVSLAVASAQARADLIASRARLVEAGDEQRRRLERNLHDGAQQHLVSSRSSCASRARSSSQAGGHGALLDEALSELGTGLEELREIARGLHPAILGEHGPRPALDALADRLPIDVELDVLRAAARRTSRRRPTTSSPRR